MVNHGILVVRNTLGERSRFSLDRFVHDEVVRGNDLASARTVGRQLLRDLRRASLDLITTDDIRHWILERDPLVFMHRRCLRKRDAAGRQRYVDPALGRIAALAVSFAPRVGPVVTELFLDHFRPGAGDVLFQDDETPGEKAPDLRDLEEQLGSLADEVFPDDADFSTPGRVGTLVDPEDETGKRLLFYIDTKDGLDLYVPRPGVLPGCDERWVLFMHYARAAPGCAGVNYRAITRAAIPQAIAAAFRVCRQTPCERPRYNILDVSWACGSDIATAFLRMEVMCLAT